MVAKRTQVKQAFHRERVMQYALPGRMTWAYDWLRNALKHLDARRDPLASARAANAALIPVLARQGAAHLLEAARRMDDAVPSSATAAWSARESGRRDRMAAAYGAACTPLDELRFAADWARSSAVQLTRCQRKYTLTALQRSECLGVRDQITGTAAEYLMTLAERAEAGDLR